MAVTIILKNNKGETIGQFPATNNQSISQMAKNNNIDIPVSCCMGACYICACKIKSGSEFVQIDKIMPPAVLPARNQKGEFEELFTCVGGIKSEYIKDQENHEVILEKNL